MDAATFAILMIAISMIAVVFYGAFKLSEESFVTRYMKK